MDLMTLAAVAIAVSEGHRWGEALDAALAAWDGEMMALEVGDADSAARYLRKVMGLLAADAGA